VKGRKIVVLGTGGTVSGRAGSGQDNVGYTAGQVGVGELLQGVALPAGVVMECEQVAQIDSKDMDFEVWRQLAERCAHWLAQADVQGVVVTHGTDTMEETAYFLQAVLAPGKPVVLTGAMRPASSNAADGPQNVADALAVAATPGARGVVVAFAGAVHAAQDVAKVHTYRLDAFSSGDAGPLGYVEEGQLRQLRPWPDAQSGLAQEKLARLGRWPRVEIVFSHAGATGTLVRSLVAEGADGIVVAATGNGTVHHQLLEALVYAGRTGVPVLRATRCAAGPVLARADDVLPAAQLSPVKARVALLLQLIDSKVA
jgi:L-asparaginase